MKAGLVVVVALMLGALAAHFLLLDNGYVLINAGGYSVEMSLPILLLLLAAAYAAIRLLVRIWRAPRKLGEAAAQARSRRAGQQVTRGLIEVAGGRLAKGERLLTRGVRNSEAPLVNYLTAARTAHAQGDRQRRDHWLAMAYEQEPAAANAVLLTQAEMHLADGSDERAQATLQKILDDVPGHAQALRLLADLHDRRGRWQDLATVAGQLRSVRGGDRQYADAIFMKSAIGRLEDPEITLDRIETVSRELTRAQRRDDAFVRARVDALARAGETGKAETEIRKALGAGWNRELVLRYGRLDHTDPAGPLKYAEGLLKNHPEDAALLLTAGRLCLRNSLWGKARSYLESSLAIEAEPAAWHELGLLMLELGEGEAASDAFRNGLAQSQGVSPDQPRLSQLKPG